MPKLYDRQTQTAQFSRPGVRSNKQQLKTGGLAQIGKGITSAVVDLFKENPLDLQTARNALANAASRADVINFKNEKNTTDFLDKFISGAGSNPELEGVSLRVLEKNRGILTQTLRNIGSKRIIERFGETLPVARGVLNKKHMDTLNQALGVPKRLTPTQAKVEYKLTDKQYQEYQRTGKLPKGIKVPTQAFELPAISGAIRGPEISQRFFNEIFAEKAFEMGISTDKEALETFEWVGNVEDVQDIRNTTVARSVSYSLSRTGRHEDVVKFLDKAEKAGLIKPDIRREINKEVATDYNERSDVISQGIANEDANNKRTYRRTLRSVNRAVSDAQRNPTPRNVELLQNLRNLLPEIINPDLQANVGSRLQAAVSAGQTQAASNLRGEYLQGRLTEDQYGEKIQELENGGSISHTLAEELEKDLDIPRQAVMELRRTTERAFATDAAFKFPRIHAEVIGNKITDAYFRSRHKYVDRLVQKNPKITRTSAGDELDVGVAPYIGFFEAARPRTGLTVDEILDTISNGAFSESAHARVLEASRTVDRELRKAIDDGNDTRHQLLFIEGEILDTLLLKYGSQKALIQLRELGKGANLKVDPYREPKPGSKADIGEKRVEYVTERGTYEIPEDHGLSSWWNDRKRWN